MRKLRASSGLVGSAHGCLSGSTCGVPLFLCFCFCFFAHVKCDATLEPLTPMCDSTLTTCLYLGSSSYSHSRQDDGRRNWISLASNTGSTPTNASSCRFNKQNTQSLVWRSISTLIAVTQSSPSSHGDSDSPARRTQCARRGRYASDLRTSPGSFLHAESLVRRSMWR
ncbi:hypothetical protein IWX50DRAFT_38803 [Phyllosticta citricarpa]